MTSTASAPGTSAPRFTDAHVGPDDAQVAAMLAVVGCPSLADLVEAAVPAAILEADPPRLPPAVDEPEVTRLLRELAAGNTIRRPMIGLGYHGTHTPAVVRRGVLESPAWYTAYTPYQPEISQGRLEALLNFQTAVADLTGTDVAGASVLDEPTAAAEAVALMHRASRAPDGAAVVLDADVLPQTSAVVATRAEAVGTPVVVADLTGAADRGEDVAAVLAAALEAAGAPAAFGVVLQQPGASGALHDVAAVTGAAHAAGALVTVAADLLAAALVRSAGDDGADVAVGSAQRFGVPMGGGGPHAGYLAVRRGLERQLPGRLVGVSQDADGAPALRLALQTREQHIRRDRATSNICTAQVLLAVMAGMYAVVHGPDGLRAVAERTHRRAGQLAAALEEAGCELVHRRFFDTVQVRLPASFGGAAAAVARAREAGYWVRLVVESPTDPTGAIADGGVVGVACDETTRDVDVAGVVSALTAGAVRPEELPEPLAGALPEHLVRASEYLTHPVFSAHRSETAVLRYLRRLSDVDYALDRGMIPLGSCTMKLNATTELEPISWPEFADLHPFAPAGDSRGTAALVADLEEMLAEVTGYAAVSVQPNAGSQGELAGLLAIRAYHRSRGDDARTVCLVPASAHGTNAASAVLAGLRVVAVATTGAGESAGGIDLDDLRAKVERHRDELAAIMVTYPSTHGVYEETITEVCELVHAAGGQVYVDGANLNALVGLARPGRFGADVSHLNLHKTFCIPHGGGGPGVGPVAVGAHLARFLPGRGEVGPVSGAPWGSAGILPIPWAYLRLMGPDGLRRATQVAVLSANYVAARLREHYPVLYTGRGGLVAHECVLDLRPLTKATGVTVDDVAKRLVDHGFHAPTVSFPVAGTLMVEPTESEDLAELDRFCDAMIAIRAEIDGVTAGTWPLERSPLRQAPHTAAMLVGEWDLPYTREQAVYPDPALRAQPSRKYWPPVRRIDGAYGDRNLVCSCPPVEALAEPS